MRRESGLTALAALLVMGACTNGVGPGADGGSDSQGSSSSSSSSSSGAVSSSSSSGGTSSSATSGSSGGAADGGVSDGGATDAGPPGLSLRDVLPNTGPVDARCGATLCRVRINGLGFSSPMRMRVFFGALEAPAAGILLVSQTAITTFLPVASGPGVVDVTVKIVDETGTELESATAPAAFTYFNKLAIASVSPPALHTRGGDTITVSGEGYEDGQLLLVGGRPASNVTVAGGGAQLIGVAPPHAAGRVDVEVVSRFGTSRRPLGVRYVPELAPAGLTPATGPVGGGNAVHLVGAGLIPEVEIRFGTAGARILDWVGDNSVLVEVPVLAAGPVDVTVSEPLLGQTVTLAGAYQVVSGGPAPALVRVNPASGTTAGGTSVHLFGRQLAGSNLAVTFGSTPATGVEVVSPDHLVAVTPAGAGTVDVAVSRGGSTLVLAGAFAFRDGVQLSSVQPQGGTAMGGTLLTIGGAQLAQNCTFTLGGVPLSVTVVDPTQATAATPAGSPGPADLAVSCPDGSTDVLEDAFRYSGPLSVLNVTPIRGSIAGGTHVRVRGTGFSTRPGLAVHFGNAVTNALTIESDSALTVFSPANGPGVVDVSVVAGMETAVRERAFTYYDPSAILGGVRGGPIDGAINVSVFDWVFGFPIPETLVVLGTDTGAQITAFTDERGQAVLSGPEVVGPQTVTVANCNFEYVTLGGVNARDITIWLFPTAQRCGPPPPPPQGGGGNPLPPPPRISGRVSGFSKELFDPANLGPNEVAAAFVFHTWPSPFSGPPGNWQMAPSQTVFVDGGEYVIPAAWRTGPMAILAMAGIYNLDTFEFRAAQLGFNRGLVADLGGVYEHRDIVLSIPLTKRLTVQFPDAPYSTTTQGNILQVSLNLGGEGAHPIIGWDRYGGEGETEYVLENFAEAPGDLFTFIAQVQSGEAGQANVLPYSTLVQDGEGPLGDAITLGPIMGFPQPENPINGGAMVERTLQVRPAPTGSRPSLFNISLQAQDGTAWVAYLEGNRTKVILPRFEIYPTREYAPFNLPAGGIYAQVDAIYAPGLDYNNWSYLDLYNGRKSWSVMQYQFVNSGN